MNDNKFIKLLCSIPVILLVLYFLPFLGVCLLIFRYFIYKSDKLYKAPLWLIIIAFLILVPYVVNYILGVFHITVPYLSDFTGMDIYLKLLKFSKTLITIGIVTVIVSYIVLKSVGTLKTKVSNGINDYMEKEATMRQENDLKIKEKQERAKTTHSVKCPKCGSYNIIYENVGKCKYCRSSLEYKGDTE